MQQTLGIVCEENSTTIQFTPSEICKQHAVHCIHTTSYHTKISNYFGVNPKIMQRILKGLDKSKADYEGIADQKPHSQVCW